MREICTSGTVRGEEGNLLVYSTFAAQSDALYRAFCSIVRQDEPTIIEEPHERLAVVVSVLERAARVAPLVLERRTLPLDPREKAVDVRTQKQRSQALDLGRRLVLPRAVQLENATDAHQSFARDRTLRDSGLPETASTVKPTGDFRSCAPVVLETGRLFPQLGGVGKEQVEDSLSVGLNVARKSRGSVRRWPAHSPSRGTTRKLPFLQG
jgi:hypothetical protein